MTSDDTANAEKGGLGLQLGEGYEPVKLDHELDCASVKKDDDLELWLIQVPIDFPLEKNATWKFSSQNSSAIATCKMDGVQYLMSEDGNFERFFAVTGNGKKDKPTHVDRRMSIFHATEAPQVCFGMDGDELGAIDDLSSPGMPEGNIVATPTVAKKVKKDKMESSDKKGKKSKRKLEDDSGSDKKKEKKKKKKNKNKD